jgi:hypothetical protein
MKTVYYIEMTCPETGSVIHKTTRNQKRALNFILRHESLGWNLASMTEWMQ